MSEPTITQSVLFGELVERSLVATFDHPHASSDGGAILLKAADRHLGLLAALTATVPDGRVPARVTHGVGDLVAQRVLRSRVAIPTAMTATDSPTIRSTNCCWAAT